jgi:hypothetical protein
MRRAAGKWSMLPRDNREGRLAQFFVFSSHGCRRASATSFCMQSVAVDRDGNRATSLSREASPEIALDPAGDLFIRETSGSQRLLGYARPVVKDT